MCTNDHCVQVTSLGYQKFCAISMQWNFFHIGYIFGTFNELFINFKTKFNKFENLPSTFNTGMIYHVISSTKLLTVSFCDLKNWSINHTAVADVIHSLAWIFDSIKTAGFWIFFVILTPLIGRPRNELPMVKSCEFSGNSLVISSRNCWIWS